MAYDQELTSRMRAVLYGSPGVTERKMFGGVAFMINGNLACGVQGEGIIVRVGQAAHEAAMQKPHVHVFDFSGKPMKGWVVVDSEGVASDSELSAWVEAGKSYAGSLPPK